MKTASPDTPEASRTVNIAMLSADAFARIAENLTGCGRITAPQADALTRFLTESRRRRLSSAQMADALGVSGTTVSRVFRGLYDGDVGAVADKAALALRLWAERDGRRRVFVDTSVSRRIMTACDFALTRQTPAIVTGLSQMGKTYAFEEYARRSDALVRIVRIPASASLQIFLAALCETLGLPTSGSCTYDRRRRILRALNDRTLLIVDELHELVVSSSRLQTRRICEVIRELYDRTRCGLVLCGTEVLSADLLRGPDAGLLDQISQRSVEIRLPRRLSADDIAAVAAAYGLPAVIPEEIRSSIRDLRMNRLCLISAMAAEAAAKRGVAPDWPLWLATKTALLGE